VVALLMMLLGMGGLLRHSQSAEGRWGQGSRGAAGGAVDTEVAGAIEVAESAMVPTTIDHLAVVRVSVTRCGKRAYGSGVLIDDGLVVTAAHVVGDAGLVRLDHGGVTVTGEVLGVLADGRDLALIAVDGPLAGPVPSAGIPTAGSPITVAGHPGGAPVTTIVGRRVDLTPAVAAIARGPAFGVSVVTDLGMSGAPALDDAGRLVGVVIGAETATGTAIVAAVDDARELAEEVVTQGRCPVVA
jgi:hypothetical protein